MPQVINTNIASLNAQRNLNASQTQANTALERLSSGLRINSAKDDAAGLAISERFQSQISGLNQAQRNANDGISLAQTAEGAMDEITNNLQRIRELAVQSANATNSISDRQALNQEVQQRIEEINRIASQTSFNGLKVLDGTFGTQTFQVGANSGETIGISGLDSRGSQIGSVLKETAVLGGFEVLPAGSVDTEVDLSASGLDFGGTQNITGTVNINGVEVSVSAPNAGGAGDIAGAITTGIATAKSEAGYNGQLDNITVAGDNTTGVIAFTNAATSDVAVDFSLTDDTITVASQATFVSEPVVTGTPSTAIDITAASNFNFANGGEINITGVADPIVIAGGQTTTQIAATLEAALRSATLDNTLTVSDASGSLTINSGATAPGTTVPGFTIDSNAVGNAYAPGPQTIDAALSEALTLQKAFADGDAFDFTVNLNGTSYDFDGLTSLNDIVSQVNAKSNDTGIKANLNSDNDEIIFSSQFGETFTVGIQADINKDGTLDATETLQNFTTVPGDRVSMNDIDISEREGADRAMIAVDYAIDTINGFRAELGAVQNRFESTIANLATTSENLSASNSRIRDADFAAESAELARTQVLQQAGLSVLAQANARPQQVLQLLQG